MKQNGFTLLEVLIAVFILAIMSMMIWQITSNTYRGTEKASKYDEVYQYGRVAGKKLIDDFSMAFLINQMLQGKKPDGTILFETNFIGEDQGDSDRADFVTFSNVRLIKNEKKGDVIKVAYLVEQCPETDEKISCLMRKELGAIDKDIKDAGVLLPIAKGIKKFNLEYYDASKQEWRSDWSTKDPVYLNKLPRAVRIFLSFQHPKNEDEEIAFTTETLLPLSAGPINF